MRLPKVRLRHLAWAVPALAVLFFAHARLEAGSSHAVTANRNPVHNFVFNAALDATYDSQRSSESATVALPESLKQLDLSGTPLLGGAKGRAKNVLIVVIEGIPGIYIPEIRKAMGVPDYSVTMEKLAGATKNAMLIPDFTVHSHQTIRGLYSILCGDFSKLSFDTPKAFELLSKPERAAACLPAQLAQHGFSTHYLQAAGLGFMAKDRVMAAVGFNEVHGVEWFEEQKLENDYHFAWGIVDSIFFQGAQRYISRLRQGKQPWMLTLLTVGTHHPFSVPDSIAAQYPSRRDATVALLDEAVAKFLRRLEADGVLEDTLVIVTSDESHGATRWDWTSSWGIHLVLAPEQTAMPRIKQGGYGLLDVEASVLDYLGLAAPPAIIGRSYFRNYDTPREMFSFTNMVLRRHTGNTSIKCAGGSACVGWQTASILSQPPKDIQELPPHLTAETYAMASALDNALRAGDSTQQFSFASGEERHINSSASSNEVSNLVSGGQYLDIPAGSDVTLHLKVTLLDGPKTGVRFKIQPYVGFHDLDGMLERAPPPQMPSDWPTVLPGESLDKSFSFHSAQKIDRLNFFLRADANDTLVRIDKFDISIRKNESGAGREDYVPQNNLSPLAIAAQLGDANRVRTLIEHGANVNAANSLGLTALMMAAFGGHADIVEMLLDSGANVNASDIREKTALGIALWRKHLNIAEILLARGADPNADFIKHLIGGRLDIARLLLEHGTNINLEAEGSKRTPLMTAVFFERENLVTFLLDNGANPNIVNARGDTALSIAVDKKLTDVAETLLAKGASANAALIPASWLGRQDVVQFLLEHGADINHAGGVGVKRTPLMHAAYDGHKDLVAFLLDNGADVHARDAVGMTALRLAELRGYTDIVEILKNANTQK
ncbi:MAG: ankyrin repeat domain-containing protein [Ottowia sp.]|nr:ankyrin repeat domain-containing protein [Ottowia sp.]